ncbi:hypothetical protein KCP69_15650 [Salmonella enterica subsp. enterica]|nr:hypothetical protein KCP69_15650 [Salmonella enterica subsp. enterica]
MSLARGRSEKACEQSGFHATSGRYFALPDGPQYQRTVNQRSRPKPLFFHPAECHTRIAGAVPINEYPARTEDARRTSVPHVGGGKDRRRQAKLPSFASARARRISVPGTAATVARSGQS